MIFTSANCNTYWKLCLSEIIKCAVISDKRYAVILQKSRFQVGSMTSARLMGDRLIRSSITGVPKLFPVRAT